MRVPLSVWLTTTLGSDCITSQIRSLRLRSAVPGGFASCSISLYRPLSVQPVEIGYYGRLYVYDARSGATVWEGRVEDLGRGAGADGQVWDINAVGPAAHAQDRTVPLQYVVSGGYNDFRRVAVNVVAGTDTVGDDPGTAGQTALVMQFPSGTPVTTGSRVAMRYTAFAEAGQKIARVSFNWDAGVTDTNYNLEMWASTDGGTFEASGVNANTAGGSAAYVVVTDWTNGRNTIDLRLIRDAGGAVTVGNDSVWVSCSSLVMMAMRYDATGTEITSGYTSNTVLASDVVADLLGRLLSSFDGANASIATTSHTIDHLAYPDGVTAAKVLADLMALESSYYWAAWETNPASGKWRFVWQAWPTSVRYEASVVDGFDSPGSAVDLYNAVRVRYRKTDGTIGSVRRTATVAALDAAGLTREALIDLGDEVGSVVNAQRAGDQYLLEHSAPPNAGTLTIARPVRDLIAGRTVAPWEIRPGELIRVRGVLPRVDALNATARDGVTVFRVVAVDYDASTAAATLELDSAPRTLQAAAAATPKVVPRRR